VIVSAVNGRITVGGVAEIPVTDRGFLYGDGVFEVLRTSKGRPVDLEAHLARLAEGMAHLDLGLLPAELAVELAGTLAAAPWPESHLRLIVTRGDDDRLAGTAASERRRVILCRPLQLHEARAQRLVLAAHVREEPSIKGLGYLASVLAVREARARGGDEALLVRDGLVLEGGSSSFFAVLDGELHTPPLGAILPGVTRARLVQLLADDGVAVREAPLPVAALARASEAFVTSSIRGVMPVAAIEAQTLVAPGPLTARAAALYAEFLLR
jgi:branched-subunit amino acid aminotransferase/4-amino-4-deoxychorismate lyase